MYQDTVTLFNRSHKASGDVFFPTVLRGVDLNADQAAIIAKYGGQSQDKAALHIRFAIQDDEKTIAGKRFMPPKEWQALSDDEKAQTVTFQTGQGFDFFMMGAWEDGVSPVQDDDYTDGFYNYLNRSMDGVYSITSAAVYSVIPHVEVMGR